MLARISSLSLVIGLSLFGMAAAADPAAELPADHAARFARGTELFKTQVRAILQQQCVKCHGGENTEAKFDLSSRESMLKGSENGAVVVPFSAAKSKLMLFLRHEKEPFMPDGEPKLAAEKLAQIESWINDGAPYDAPFDDKKKATDWLARRIPAEAKNGWAFRPLQVVEPPAARDPAWGKSPIDRFVAAGLAAKGLKPNPPVDRRQLIRRVYLDLTGLPPTGDEVEAFVANPSPDAYPKLLDKLLESPHYGERWGRYWLDVSRFAESHGFEQDYDRPYAYHFRDFAIKALNQDMPYDQFVRWQLAGDELAPNDPLAMMATGFLGAGVFPTQITANEVERSRYDAIDDMTATMGTAMLGLTIGCARCHDHKFDPIPAADYYRIASTFTTTVRSEIDLDLTGGTNKEAEEKFQKEHAPLAEALKKFEAEQLPARLAAWEKEKSAGQASPWSVIDFASTKSQGGATLTRQEDGSLLASGSNPNFDTYTFVAKPVAGEIRSIRLEALAHPSMVRGGPGRAGNGNIALTDFRVTAVAASPNPKGDPKPIALKLTNPRATFEQAPSLLVKFAIDADKKSAWALDPQFGKDHAAIFDLEAPLNLPGGAILTFTLEFQNNNQHNIGRPRLSASSQAGLPAATGDGRPAAIAPILATPADKRTAEQQKTLLSWYRSLDPEWQKLQKAVDEHLAKKPKSPMTKVMVCSEGLKPIRHHTQGADFFNDFYFLKRGDVTQKQGIAQQGFLQVLSRAEGDAPEKRWQAPAPAGARTSYRRTALANWITDTEAGAGHLLARVIVNRVWHHHFGRGIVGTPNDFGLQGEAPTHPELLEWLASDFMKSGGWRLKYLHRQILTSQAYLQSAAFDAEKSKIDPQNRYLWRYAPRRLEAESIRDSMLSVSGALDQTMFGPGTLDEGHQRRSIYFMIKRSRLISMMQIFDQPEPLVSVGNRPSTTIAPQALAFMNSPHVRKYAHQFAGRLLPLADKTPEEAIRKGYLDAVGRAPTTEELADNLAFLKKQSESYAAEKKPRPLELALADFCQVLFCLNDFVYVE